MHLYRLTCFRLAEYVGLHWVQLAAPSPEISKGLKKFFGVCMASERLVVLTQVASRFPLLLDSVFFGPSAWCTALRRCYWCSHGDVQISKGWADWRFFFPSNLNHSLFRELHLQCSIRFLSFEIMAIADSILCKRILLGINKVALRSHFRSTLIRSGKDSDCAATKFLGCPHKLRVWSQLV